MTHSVEISSTIRKRTLGLAFVLGAASLAFAQQKVTITGSVTDKNNSPVPYASITFNNSGNKALSDAALTDEKGQYKLELTPGKYDIDIDAIGFSDFTKEQLIEKAGNLSAFVLSPEAVKKSGEKTTEIETIQLTASVKAYKVELDKKVYDVNQDIVSKGGSLQDVLSNVPSVAVDTDGSVSMRGNSNVRFLINGKPSSLLGIDDGADALKTIPADQIDRIEVITNPSSKFEASGTAGILNIILKKDKKMGFNGTVTGSVGYLPRTNLNASLNWRKGNWTWFVNGGGGYNENESSSKNTTTQKTALSSVTNFPFNQFSQQDGKNKRNGSNYNMNAGVVYDISDKTSVNLSGMIRTFDNDQNALNKYTEKTYSSASVFDDISRTRETDGRNKNFATQIDFGLDQKLDDNGQNITFAGSVQSNKTDGNSLITQNSYINSNWQPNGYKLNNIDTESKSNTFLGKVDYELPIGENSKLEAGARYDYNKNKYAYFVDQSTNGINFQMMTDFTSNTTYKENIFGVYAQFKSKIGSNFGYQVGLRSETSSIDIDFNYYKLGVPAHESVNKNYTKLFPTVFLSYNLGNQDQLLLNYSRRINRPRAFSLIPFMSFDDDRNYFRGNPDLNPTYENSFEFGYSISKKSFTINPTLYFKKSEDEQNRYQYMDSTGAINIIPYNVGTETNYGLDLNGTYDPFKWWKLMFSADLYGYKNTGSFNLFPNNPSMMNDFSGDGFSYRLRLNNTFKIDKTFSIQIQSQYRAGEKTAMFNRKANYGIDLGASKTIWNGNGTISLNVRDVFNTRRMRGYFDSPLYTRESEMQWQPRQVGLSFTYKFKQGEKVEVKKKQKDINNNYQGDDEMGQGGI